MNLNGYICSLHQYGYMTYADFLRHLPERFNLQPKQGWSEEDETYLQDALWCIEKAEKIAKDEGDMGACWSAKRWLKSLPKRFSYQTK